MKTFVKALAVLLAVCFCFSALMFVVGAAASDVPEQGAFEFGSYPQTRVKDQKTIAALNKARESTKSDLVTYRGVRYYASTIKGNSFYDSKPDPFAIAYGYAMGVVYWFKYEPITWRVLDQGKDGVLLMSELVLDTHAFNESIRADNTWENSDVRTWLRDTFTKTAFTPVEQAYLLDSDLTNEPNPIRGTYNGVASSYAGEYSGGYPFVGTYSGGPTTDKVFLPSFNEITNADYGFNIGWKDKTGDFGESVGYYETDIEPGEHCARSTSATDFAKSQGAWANLKLDPETGKETGPVETCRYWLRTAGYNSIAAAAVLEDGRVSTGWDVNYNIVGIRPMVRVSPDAVADIIDVPTDEPEDLPFNIYASETEFHYKQQDVKFTADVPVTWASSDPRIASIDENTGVVTIHRVGTVTITATSKETGKTVEFTMDITYLWWQMLIRIFLFGWAWY